MTADKPLWWQPVMSEMKSLIVPFSPTLWEAFRQSVSEGVKGTIIRWDMTDEQARQVIGTLLITIVEELQKPIAERNTKRLVENLMKVELL